MKSTLSAALLVLLVLALVPADGLTEEKAVQLSLFNPLQIRPEDTSIKYFRFNLIYGKNTSLVGLDLGLVNHLTAGESKALRRDFQDGPHSAHRHGRFEHLPPRPATAKPAKPPSKPPIRSCGTLAA